MNIPHDILEIIRDWRPIVGYEGYYISSRLSEIKSLNYNGTGRVEFMKTLYDRGGYEYVNLHKNGKGKSEKVHRLVALTFIPNPDNLPQVNHIDENKANNFVWNLEWCTAKYNSNYGTHCEKLSKANKGRVITKEWRENMSKARRGKKPSEATRKKWSEMRKGENNYNYNKGVNIKCYETDEIFLNSMRAAEWIIEQGLSNGNKNGIAGSIRRCCEGRPKTAYGFHWAYVDSEGNISENDLIRIHEHINSKGREFTEEHIKNIRKAKAKKVLCIETGEIFECVSDATEKYKPSHNRLGSQISRCCLGHKETAYGLHWEYVEE